jgi:hypothetical protein
MKPQIIHHPTGESLVVLTLKEYEALRAQAEDAEDWADLAKYHECMRELETGKDEWLPEDVTRLQLAGNSLVKSLRLWSGKSEAEVCKIAGIRLSDLSAIENRETTANEETLKRIAAALEVPTTWLV